MDYWGGRWSSRGWSGCGVVVVGGRWGCRLWEEVVVLVAVLGWLMVVVVGRDKGPGWERREVRWGDFQGEAGEVTRTMKSLCDLYNYRGCNEQDFEKMSEGQCDKSWDFRCTRVH